MHYTMPSITLQPISLGYPRSSHVRTPGIHVSSVIRNIAIGSGILKSKVPLEDLSLVEVDGNEWWDKDLTEEDRIRICLGLAWEQWYIPQLSGVIDHPGEMEVDGIYMTPDGESLDTVIIDTFEKEVIAIHEIKATSKKVESVWDPSTGKVDLSSQWMWLMQMKAYCKGAGTRLCYLHVLFYASWKPQVLRWRVEFTQQEIDTAWDVILECVREYKERS